MLLSGYSQEYARRAGNDCKGIGRQDIIGPYIRIVEALDLEYFAPAGVSIGKGSFYDDSTVLSADLGVGLRYEVSPTVAAGLETGVNYQGHLDDKDLGGGALDDLNNGGRRWQLPLYLGVNIQL